MSEFSTVVNTLKEIVSDFRREKSVMLDMIQKLNDRVDSLESSRPTTYVPSLPAINAGASSSRSSAPATTSSSSTQSAPLSYARAAVSSNTNDSAAPIQLPSPRGGAASAAEIISQFPSDRQAGITALLANSRKFTPVEPPTALNVTPPGALKLVYVSGLNFVTLTAIRQLLYNARFFMSKIRNISWVGRSHLEFLLLEEYAPLFESQIAKTSVLTIVHDFDPRVHHKDNRPIALQEAQERFAARVSKIINNTRTDSVKEFFVAMVASSHDRIQSRVTALTSLSHQQGPNTANTSANQPGETRPNVDGNNPRNPSGPSAGESSAENAATRYETAEATGVRPDVTSSGSCEDLSPPAAPGYPTVPVPAVAPGRSSRFSPADGFATEETADPATTGSTNPIVIIPATPNTASDDGPETHRTTDPSHVETTQTQSGVRIPATPCTAPELPMNEIDPGTTTPGAPTTSPTATSSADPDLNQGMDPEIEIPTFTDDWPDSPDPLMSSSVNRVAGEKENENNSTPSDVQGQSPDALNKRN
jgi:hypothetical protein